MKFSREAFQLVLLSLDRSCSYWLLTVRVLTVSFSTGVIKSVVVVEALLGGCPCPLSEFHKQIVTSVSLE